MNGGEGNARSAIRWLGYEEEDMRVAVLLSTQPDLAPRHTCWHSQQAAEKSLKALLLLETGEFERLHRLEELADVLPEPLAERIPRPGLSLLTNLYTQARYPGRWPEATSVEAMTAVMTARAVYDAVNEEFQRRGAVTGQRGG